METFDPTNRKMHYDLRHFTKRPAWRIAQTVTMLISLASALLPSHIPFTIIAAIILIISIVVGCDATFNKLSIFDVYTRIMHSSYNLRLCLSRDIIDHYIVPMINKVDSISLEDDTKVHTVRFLGHIIPFDTRGRSISRRNTVASPASIPSIYHIGNNWYGIAGGIYKIQLHGAPIDQNINWSHPIINIGGMYIVRSASPNSLVTFFNPYNKMIAQTDIGSLCDESVTQLATLGLRVSN